MFKRIRDSIADYFRETDKVLLLLCIAAACYGAVIILSATFISSGYSKFFVQLIEMCIRDRCKSPARPVVMTVSETTGSAGGGVP